MTEAIINLQALLVKDALRDCGRLDHHRATLSLGYFARPLYPSVSIATWYTAPRATMYSVFLPGPAKAKLLGFLDTGIVPRCLPCGLKTWMPAAVAAYTRSWPSIAMPSPPNLTSGVPFGLWVTISYLAKLRRFFTVPSCWTSKAKMYSPPSLGRSAIESVVLATLLCVAT